MPLLVTLTFRPCCLNFMFTWSRTARQRVIKDLNTPEGARWFLSKNKRAREDFGEHATVDLTTNKDDKAKIQTKNSLLDNIFSKKK